MGKLNRSNKGFGGIELFLVIVIIVLLGVVGWFVYKHYDRINSTASPTSSNVKDFIMVGTTKSAPYDQSYVRLAAPSQITSNPTDIQILNDLHNGCKNNSKSYIYASPTTFNNSGATVIDGNYALLQLIGLCLAKSVTTHPDEAQSYYIYKNSSGVWVDNQTVGDGPPSCSSVDGLGFPSSIIPSCFESDGTDRVPTN